MSAAWTVERRKGAGRSAWLWNRSPSIAFVDWMGSGLPSCVNSYPVNNTSEKTRSWEKLPETLIVKRQKCLKTRSTTLSYNGCDSFC